MKADIRLIVCKEILSDGSNVFNLKLGDTVIHCISECAAYTCADKIERAIRQASNDTIQLIEANL